MIECHQETEFHLTIGVTVRGTSESEQVTPHVVDAVTELLHTRHFQRGLSAQGVVATDERDHGRILVTTTLARGRRLATGSTLPQHQQRVLAEKIELDLRINALDAFICRRPAFASAPADEQARLKRQLDVMHELSSILGERIANF